MDKSRLTLRALKGERYFKWRGGDVSRLEGLTDAVIALAMTLLVVSLEVPNNWTEMLEVFKQIPVLLICFAMLVMLWFYNFQFHRRFGLENFYTVFLNAVFVFLVLVFVLPLKFLFTALLGQFFGLGPRMPADLNGPQMMIIYSSGVVAIFLVLLLMNLHAYKHRELLELDFAERRLTRAAIAELLIHISIALISIVLAACASESRRWLMPASGMIYFLVGPLQGIKGYLVGRRLERDLDSLMAE